jgi:hypothetical protein
MTAPIDAIQKVACMLYNTGVVCDFGVDESCLPGMIDMARVRYPSKAIRAVKNWMWWDFEVSEETHSHFQEKRVQPAIIFAHHLIWDSSKRWSEGWNVKTTALVTFEENCFFITRNTVYILVGKVHRKTVDPQAAVSLHF